MKRYKQWLLILSALLLTALGAALPRLVSTIQDANVQNLQEDRPLSAARLTLLQDGGIRETLRLVAEAEQAGTLTWTGRTAMTEDEAIVSARKMLERMLADGMIPAPDRTSAALPYGTEYIETRMVLSPDGSSLPVIVWLYTCDGVRAVLYMDDATGQMVRMSALAKGDASTETDIGLAEDWRMFLTEYYGFELLPDYEHPSLTEDEEPYRHSFPLLLDMGEQREPCRLNIAVYDSMLVSFNS